MFGGPFAFPYVTCWVGPFTDGAEKCLAGQGLVSDALKVRAVVGCGVWSI